jgi:hypothetical protein
MRKYEEKEKILTTVDISNSLHLGENKDVYFIVGNLNYARNIWIIIKVFCFDKKMEQIKLL